MLIVLLIVLVILGPTQPPKLAKAIGKSMKRFQHGMEEEIANHEKEENRVCRRQHVPERPSA